jgi:hypothetical protein
MTRSTEEAKMKKSILARALLVTGTIVIAGACDDGLVDLNRNPNAPTDVGAEFLLPQSIRSAAENTFDSWMMFHHTSIWSHQTVQIQYPDEETGQVRPGQIQNFWTSFYAGSLRDIQTVIEKAEAGGRSEQAAVGRIWKSWNFHIMTDLWGDLPYSEALRAEEGLTTPAYDTQQQVYDDLFATLTSAASALQGGGGDGFGSGDLLYGNDFEKWRRFANSLRMRLAMRLSEVDAATAQSEFQAAYNAGGFQSNADNAMLGWPGPPYQNPIFENWQGRDDDGVSEMMIEKLKSLADPRLELYAEPAAEDGEYRGLGNNIEAPPLSLSWYSRIGNFWRANGAATPTAIMTYSEVLFLEAEAAQRGWIAGDPAALYEAAIRANMNQYDAWSPANAPTDQEVDTYLAQAAVQFDASKAIEQINTQKWISLYMQGTEAYANQRRIDFPVLTPGPDLTLSRLPVRFMYPEGEQSLNSANLDQAVQRQSGGLDLLTPVWWDVK